MTATSLNPGTRQGAPGTSQLNYDSLPIALIVAAAAAYALATGFPILVDVWRNGTFADTDDAMRMAQVRDLLAGQKWFDMTAYRLDPPSGLFIHWSRIVDIPLVVLVKGFGLLLPAEQAERAARIAYPLLLTFGVLWTLARAAAILIGRKAILPALLVCALGGIGVGQFQPGRIDHHSAQIVLLVLMLCLSLRAVEPGQAKAAGFAAVAASISFGISVENITYFVLMSAAWPLFWLRDGRQWSLQLRWYGLGLLISLPVTFASTIAPSRWTATACDALSATYFIPAIIGAAGCCLLSLASPALGRKHRLAALAALAISTVFAFFVISPDCLRGPLGAVDPLLRRYWLENVVEARNILAAITLNGEHTILIMGPALLGVVFAALAMFCERGVCRDRWLIAFGFMIVGVVTAIWQIRAASSLAPISAMGCAWAIIRLRTALEAKMTEGAAIMALAAALPLSTTGWAAGATLLKSGHRQGIGQTALASSPGVVPEDCFRPESYAVASRLKSGVVAAPIDLGSYLLAHTAHYVLAAAYHRNNHGNRVAVDIFLASPSSAELRVRAAKVEYLAYCVASPELELMKRFAPGGLGAELGRGRVPEWLEPVTEEASVRIFRVRN